MRIRLKFEKKGNIRLIGHLDMLRYFQKAIRRAALPIKYSEGFHPHQLLSFAMPLGVGVESEGEYLDLELIDEEVKRECEEKKLPKVRFDDDENGPFLPEPYLMETVTLLNEEMAEGVKVLSARVIRKKEKNAMAAVAFASYDVLYPEDTQNLLKERGYDEGRLREELEKFYDRADAIPVLKKTKKSEREVDLKPLILSLLLMESENPKEPFFFRMLLSAGSENNVKPQLVMAAFHRFLGLHEDAIQIRILRRDLPFRPFDRDPFEGF